MRIITWNLQHGGGKRIGRFCDALETYDADLLVLTEYRHNKVSEKLHAWLEGQGYRYRLAPHASPRKNIVLIAAKKPFEAVMFPGQAADEEHGDFTHRVLMARLGDLNIMGLYLPGGEKKWPVYDFLMKLPSKYREGQTILIGDFNTGRHYEDEKGASFSSAEQFDALLEQGWIDSWRSRNPEAREFTWYSRGYNNGFRLDHALVTPSVNDRIVDVRYSHYEREAGVSDHSMMILDLAE